jgi:dihydroorotate dehydrogenase
MAPSTHILRKFREAAPNMTLIGAGGVESADDAYAKIKAGATVVQLYSALVYRGPGLVGRIKRDLANLLRADGYASVEEARGTE